MQSRYKIARQERAVAGHAYHPGDVWRAPSRPIEAGENAGERARITWHAVGDDREPGVGEARKIAIGIEDQLPALRTEPGDDAVENGRAADGDAGLVGKAHAACASAGEHEAEGWGNSHGGSLAGAINRRRRARARSAPRSASHDRINCRNRGPAT